MVIEMTTAPVATTGIPDPGLAAILARFAPGVGAAMADLHKEARGAVDPAILELCRLRLATLMGDEAETGGPVGAAPAMGPDEEKIAELADWPTSVRFTAADRACLAFAEQFVGDVSSLTAEDCEAVLAHLDPPAFYGFVTALLALDGHQRLRLTLAGLGIGEGEYE